MMAELINRTPRVRHIVPEGCAFIRKAHSSLLKYRINHSEYKYSFEIQLNTIQLQIKNILFAITQCVNL